MGMSRKIDSGRGRQRIQGSCFYWFLGVRSFCVRSGGVGILFFFRNLGGLGCGRVGWFCFFVLQFLLKFKFSGVEKIKIIGSTYMVVVGFSVFLGYDNQVFSDFGGFMFQIYMRGNLIVSFQFCFVRGKGKGVFGFV